MAEIKNVMVAGAGGTVGPALVEGLLAAKYTVSVLTREESKSTFPEGVNVVRTDYSPESLKTALTGQDAVVSALAGVALGSAEIALIDAAVATGVKRFLPSEFGGDSVDPSVVALVPFWSGKAKTIEHLKSKEGQGLSWTGVATGTFFDWGLHAGFHGADFKTQTFSLWDNGDVMWSTTNLSTVGKTVATVLQPEHYAATSNTFLYIASYTMSQNQLLAAVQKATGSEWKVKKIEYKPAMNQAFEELQKGNWQAVLPILQGATFGPEAKADFRVQGLWNEKLGLPVENMDEDIKKVADVYKV